MMRIAMSSAAGALFRAFTARAGVSRDRILLTDVHSIDWQSLTFTGERHHFEIGIGGADSAAIAHRFCDGLEEAEFSIPGLLVADIRLIGSPKRKADGGTELMIEALTISDD
jgi:hypothetical protein